MENRETKETLYGACNVFKTEYWQIYYATSFQGQNEHSSNISYFLNIYDVRIQAVCTLK
jgi:hypothetical protein